MEASKAVGSRTAKILSLLMEQYGTEPWNWHTQQSPFQVLIGTVLSQRTRDEKTDEAAQALLSRYPSPDDVSRASCEEIESLIRPANYYKTKAGRIKEICRILVDEYSGEVPATREELMKLPGVGSKTAACVMVYGFRKPAIPVDTHVHRISNRMGIVRARIPEETERELRKVLPREFDLHVNELLVKHGQSICRPLGPLCSQCIVRDLCDFEPKQVNDGGSGQKEKRGAAARPPLPIHSKQSPPRTS